MNDNGKRRAIRLPRGVYIFICILPVLSMALFYSLRNNILAMDWIAGTITAPIRGALGLFSSIYPYSLMEVLFVLGGIWLIYYLFKLIKTIIQFIKKRERASAIGKRLLTIIVVLLYCWSIFSWLWNSAYHAPGFADNHGFTGQSVTAENLKYVSMHFVKKANELAVLMPRDENGSVIGDRRELFAMSTEIYGQVFKTFPQLETRLYKPKPMMFSWLMSRTGYTGIYFAPTGESNINTRSPIFLMPATIAHELAHQCGVAREDEANFIGILACISSDNLAYEYAGYLMGLIYLRNALTMSSFTDWLEFDESMSDEVRSDLQANSAYWQRQKTVETGVVFIDNALTTVTTIVSETVNTAYDGFLKSQDQELGLMSYGACVDLLVEYFATFDSTE